MMTVRFPNGQSVRYNTAGFASRKSEYTDLYTKNGGDWIAQIPNTCIIEAVPACKVYDGLRDSREEITEEVRLLRRTIREFKKILKEGPHVFQFPRNGNRTHKVYRSRPGEV